MKKISIIFGTRPEAIKFIPLILNLSQLDFIKLEVVFTGQHKEMVYDILELFNIIPTINFNVMKANQSLGELNGNLLLLLSEYFQNNHSDLVLVQGDTSSTFCGGLAAYFNKIPIAYVESGLRTNNLFSPWPEEGNRKMTSTISDLNFAPSELSKLNLLNEGIDSNKIWVTGNTSIDTLKLMVSLIDKNVHQYFSKFPNNIFDKKVILITCHRRENLGSNLYSICLAIKQLAKIYFNINFIFPVHLNPEIQKTVYEILSQDSLSNVYLLNPLTYDDFVFVMVQSFLILTDSGGIQEEAPSLGKPVLVVRDTTERPEAITAGTSKLIGTKTSDIVSSVSELINNTDLHKKMSNSVNPYGDGNASNKIIDICLKHLNER